MRIIIKPALTVGVIIFCYSLICQAQFPPPAGQPGSTAIFKDSTVFVGWATGCTVHRGYIKISDTTLTYQGDNRANYGSADSATGKADGTPVSLGDGGWAVLTFPNPVTNGTGFDFAVFENAFNDTFLELGFVEVSSDGITYVRFPATSLTQDTVQVPFVGGSVDATKIDNLAGKYRMLFGTPFDLELLKGSPGLDVNKITHIRIIDVTGCIQPLFATHDSKGDIVNDPWPTPFNTGGFDLDAVGVLHFNFSYQDEPVLLYPNPTIDKVTVNLLAGSMFDLALHDVSGKEIWEKKKILNNTTLDIGFLSAGIYFATFTMVNGTIEVKKIIKR